MGAKDMKVARGGYILAGILWAQAVAWAAASPDYQQNFDAGAGVAEGWRADATGSDASLATWKAAADSAAPSLPNVLTMQFAGESGGGVYNLYWSPKVQFQDGELQVSVRADTGKIDQGGGLVWRVQNPDNYYVARYNPLESNYRVYVVSDGRRHQLASTEGIRIEPGQWFGVRISHVGDRIQGWLDGRLAWEITDRTIRGAGGVGFWTKADAASSFDDLKVFRRSQPVGRLRTNSAVVSR